MDLVENMSIPLEICEFPAAVMSLLCSMATRTSSRSSSIADAKSMASLCSIDHFIGLGEARKADTIAAKKPLR